MTETAMIRGLAEPVEVVRLHSYEMFRKLNLPHVMRALSPKNPHAHGDELLTESDRLIGKAVRHAELEPARQAWSTVTVLGFMATAAALADRARRNEPTTKDTVIFGTSVAVIGAIGWVATALVSLAPKPIEDERDDEDLEKPASPKSLHRAQDWLNSRVPRPGKF